jgi:spermidine dehydrogenase
MNAHDRALGLDQPITRRDFLNGVALTVVGSMLAPELAQAAQREFVPERAPDYYPPTRVGMRGSHAGSFEVAHQLRDRRQWDLSAATDTGESYDLVIVGGGLSGLSAAYFFIRDVGRNARVLILDNHDDFGGHAKRNEFHYAGRMLALNGGTLNIESWDRYNEHARAVIHDIGIDIDRFYDPMEWVYTSTNDRPCVVARQPFGLITIANADAAASPHTDAAMLEAHRAVQEVLQRRAMPLLNG